MSLRVDYRRVGAKALEALMGVEQYLGKTGLDPKLRGLIYLRASQINGCAFCVNMHYGELKKAGVPDAHINLVSVWRESPCFNEKERAVLAWTETVTRLSETHVPDAEFERVRAQFTDAELVDMTVSIAQINVWNRLAVSFRAEPHMTAAGV